MISRTGRSLLLGIALASGMHFTTTAIAQDKGAGTKPDPGKGQQIAGAVCSACHAADGNSTISANPKLAGQHFEYLYRQLVAFTKPASDKAARVNSIMSGFAGQLSDEDKRNVSAYFAAQKAKPGAARNKEALQLGQRIYRTGIAEKSVPACAGCHGPTGAGIPIQYPRIGGQHAEYTEGQLKAFRDGTRRNNVPMAQIAARLSDVEMKAVSDYIDGLR
jgi:cytochrome c553